MKSLFRRTYQSKTNCCLSEGKNLLHARELGRTASRGFLLALNFHALLAAAQEQGFLPETSLSKYEFHPPRTKLQARTVHFLVKSGSWCAGVVVWVKIWSQRLFDVNLILTPLPLSVISKVRVRKQYLVTADIFVLHLSSELLQVYGTGRHIPIVQVLSFH